MAYWRATYTVNYVVHHKYQSLRATRYYKYYGNLERWKAHWKEKMVSEISKQTGYPPTEWWFDTTVGEQIIQVPTKGVVEYVHEYH